MLGGLEGAILGFLNEEQKIYMVVTTTSLAWWLFMTIYFMKKLLETQLISGWRRMLINNQL